MNAVTIMAPASAVRLSPDFEAWRIPEAGRSIPLEVAAVTLADALNDAAHRCQHKEHLAIRETAPISGEVVIHFYAIQRKSKPRWVYVDHVSRAVHDLYPVHLFSIPAVSFEPQVPWGWSPGADVIGIDRSVVNGGEA